MRHKCEGPLTLLECKNVVDDLADNKTPGNDGISAEFYKRFWHSISDI